MVYNVFKNIFSLPFTGQNCEVSKLTQGNYRTYKYSCNRASTINMYYFFHARFDLKSLRVASDTFQLLLKPRYSNCDKYTFVFIIIIGILIYCVYYINNVCIWVNRLNDVPHRILVPISFSNIVVWLKFLRCKNGYIFHSTFNFHQITSKITNTK